MTDVQKGVAYTPEEVKASLQEYKNDFLALLITKIIPELKDLIVLMNSETPCKQYQLALMDAESMLENLEDLRDNGPSPRLAEIPLSASEVQEDFIFPEDIEMAQEPAKPEFV